MALGLLYGVQLHAGRPDHPPQPQSPVRFLGARAGGLGWRVARGERYPTAPSWEPGCPPRPAECAACGWCGRSGRRVQSAKCTSRALLRAVARCACCSVRFVSPRRILASLIGGRCRILRRDFARGSAGPRRSPWPQPRPRRRHHCGPAPDAPRARRRHPALTFPQRRALPDAAPAPAPVPPPPLRQRRQRRHEQGPGGRRGCRRCDGAMMQWCNHGSMVRCSASQGRPEDGRGVAPVPEERKAALRPAGPVRIRS